MKRIRKTLQTLITVIIVTIITIILLESEGMQEIRDGVTSVFGFLKGKRALLSNIFLGIFASAFCMWLGELVGLVYLKRELKEEINELHNELWVKMNFKNDCSMQGYIDNAQTFIHYQDKIERLYLEFKDINSIEDYIIGYLHSMLLRYKAIYENEYMVKSNINLMKEYFELVLKPFGMDLKKFYFESVHNEEIMKIRIKFEKELNISTQYFNDRERYLEANINEIKKMENKLNEIYKKMYKIQ